MTKEEERERVPRDAFYEGYSHRFQRPALPAGITPKGKIPIHTEPPLLRKARKEQLELPKSPSSEVEVSKTLAVLPRKTDAKPTPAAEATPGRRPPVPPNDGKVAQGPEHDRFIQDILQ